MIPVYLASSDCISIKTHSCVVEIQYSNSSNFAGLDYPESSPPTSFNILIPAVFFHDSNVAEQEDIELSDETIVRLYDKLEQKRMLEVGFMPDYMHTKLQMVLMHDFVSIDGIEWLRRDEYQKIEGNRRYPLKRANVLLTDKNFIKENQLS